MPDSFPDVIWRCPTCGAPLEGTVPLTCNACGKSAESEGRLLDFSPLTPAPKVGLFGSFQFERGEPNDAHRAFAGDRRTAHTLKRIVELARGELCLEIGPGNGQMTPALEGLFDRVVAVDYAEPLLRLVVERTRSATCLIADANFLPLRDRHVDFVVLTEVLEHVTTPTQVLREIARVLKPDGLVFITVPNERTLNPFKIKDTKRSRDIHVNFFDSIALSRLLTVCGFELVDIRTSNPKLTWHRLLLNPWRLRRCLPGLGKLVECVARPARAHEPSLASSEPPRDLKSS